MPCAFGFKAGHRAARPLLAGLLADGCLCFSLLEGCAVEWPRSFRGDLRSQLMTCRAAAATAP